MSNKYLRYAARIEHIEPNEKMIQIRVRGITNDATIQLTTCEVLKTHRLHLLQYSDGQALINEFR